MNGRLRGCSSHRRERLTTGWEMTPSPTAPSDSSQWLAATVPGTVAGALQSLGQWSLDSAPRAFDSEQWWFRRRFEAPVLAQGERLVLGIEGLATLAEVWLNGAPLLQSANMFEPHEIDIGAQAKTSNELLIRFAPLEPFLAKRRPRPRWRTPMVAHQQMRWIRTTLLGRTPGWSPPAAPVGPWRPVWIERRSAIDLRDLRLSAQLNGGSGSLELSAHCMLLGGAALHSASLVVTRNGRRHTSPLAITDSNIHGRAEVPDVEPWWPHTHGEPALYDASIEFELRAGAAPPSRVVFDLGPVGFRTVTVDRSRGDFRIDVNGTAIFCRGAVWTPLDCVGLNPSVDDYRLAIEQVRAAGMNMLRVSGPFIYESDTFLDLCDAAGVMLWQDFMFANMDYPADDAEFSASVAREVSQLLPRFQARPSLAVLCGNSEGAQQAAMSGAAREHWAPALFEKTLADYSADLCPGVPYCPSSTHGGDYPFLPSQGATSYYGVGAYLQPFSDARRSEVKFGSECLGFANVPESETLSSLERPLHYNQPRWRERVPRDLGAGWDFEDVRDRYLERLFRVEAAALRYADQDRYMRLSRAVSGEAMAGAFTEWRRAGSVCRGALVWFLRDLWPGAGWGVIDSTGLPKAAYYYLKRSLRDLGVFITDEGSNGLSLHVTNEGSATLAGRLQIELFKLSDPVGRPVAVPVTVAPRDVTVVNAVQLFEGFIDLSYYYRFGPPAFDVMRASFTPSAGQQQTFRPTSTEPEPVETFYFPLGLPNTQTDIGLSARAQPVQGGVEVHVQCRGFAQSVHIEAPGYVADDQYFHMAPRSVRTVRLSPTRPQTGSTPFEGMVHALNSASPRRIEQST
ncbi:MAG TPA: glycoside hydrolase family 2 protein [Steroidobacteraceae bacterium]